MPFTIKTRRSAACEVPARREAHRAFVAVDPPVPQFSRWIVRRFEIPVELMDEYFGDEDLVDSQKEYREDLAGVEALLAEWNIDTGLFDAPWKCDYPL